jgi:hypothetical protein
MREACPRGVSLWFFMGLPPNGEIMGSKFRILKGGFGWLLAGGLSACATAAPTPQVGVLAPEASVAMVAEAGQMITAADMERRIGLLAADSMRGRDTPSPELETAARYIAGEFERLGLRPAGDGNSFLQRWPYTVATLAPEGTYVRLRDARGPPLRYGEDFFLIPSPAEQVAGRIFYAGEAGAAALPGDARGTVVLFELAGADMDMAWQGQISSAIGAAMAAGAGGIGLILDPAFPGEAVAQLAPMLAAQQAPVPIVGMTRRAGEALFSETAAARAPPTAPTLLADEVLEIGARVERSVHRPANVVAMLPGTDPVLRETFVVLTAHYDHVGIGPADEAGDSIYNGADDNASGTAALLEIAEAFTALPERPLRSVLFLAVSGEEKGLLGSMYFAQNPTVPQEGMIANINMDMISRNAPDTLIAIGQEYSTFADVLEQVLADHPEVGLTVIRDPYPEERLFFRSDQLSFIQQGIPALFFFTGLHEDYHRPSDTPERSDPEKAARVARLSFYVAHRVATSREPPEWTEEGRREVEALLQAN